MGTFVLLYAVDMLVQTSFTTGLLYKSQRVKDKGTLGSHKGLVLTVVVC